MSKVLLLAVVTVAVAVAQPVTGPFPIVIDSGSPTDMYFTGGNAATFVGPVTDTTVRFGNFSYHIPVDNVPWLVTFNWVEYVVTGAGKRLFQVRANDQVIFDRLDLFVVCGGWMVPCSRTVLVTPTAGTLDLVFATQTSLTTGTRKAMVSAISLTPLFGFTGTSLYCDKFAPRAIDDPAFPASVYCERFTSLVNQWNKYKQFIFELKALKYSDSQDFRDLCVEMGQRA